MTLVTAIFLAIASTLFLAAPFGKGVPLAQASVENTPATGLPTISGTVRVGETLAADTSGISDEDGLKNASFDFQWIANDGKTNREIDKATSSTYTLVAADEGKTIRVMVSLTDDKDNDESLTSAATDVVAAVGEPAQQLCSGGGYDPVPIEVDVAVIPIVVESTIDEYFVLYVGFDLDADSTVYLPVSVTLGQASTTTLFENVAALPKERYRVEKYLVADPADVDGDCIDDITELEDLGTMSPVNPAPAISLFDGAVAVPDRDTFETLSYNQQYLKFVLLDMDTDRPILYFINSTTHTRHPIVLFLQEIGLSGPDLPWSIPGEIVYHPELLAPDGSPGVYYYWLNRYDNRYTFSLLARFHALLAAGMPLLEDNLVLYIPNFRLPSYQSELALLNESRIPLVFDEDIHPETGFLALNSAEGYGRLRVMELDERPNPRDVVIYEALPNELPRVAGIISAVPQTPLSHVNLRAVQDGVPNSFIRDALDNTDIDDLIDSYVHYTVTEDGWTLAAATPAEVDAHYASSRPSTEQTPQRDLSVTEITPLSEVGFEDWTAFGVKAANVAVLGTLGFPDGTVPDGFAVPFYFYDEFMKHNELYDDIEEMLADPDFQTDFDVQEDELKKLRKAIKRGETPEWIIEALTEMHATYPDGQSLRYRSSTNNEDLSGFNGAGLYDSKTQHPEETEEDGIAKSLKQVYASLWNFRAFTEREFHRISHLAAAMGVLVHPNYSDELANGVAVSFDPIRSYDDYYYVNTQLGEDLVTNPDAHSEPEEVRLHRSGGYYEILATSNQTPPGELLMSDDQLDQLGEHLAVIHEEFAELYSPEPGEPFAMEIEFKITSENILAIKQARPWVFSVPSAAPAANNPATGAPTISGTAQVGETLTADTSGIADADGLESVTFSYQWLADDDAIAGATGSTYTLADADEGKAITVQVSFTDDAGHDETLTSAATDAVTAAPPENNPATGAPTIRGTAQVGETLIADTSGISDADGLDDAVFGYQWLADNAAIAGATASTYTLADADEGKAITVQVSFTDDGGNDETLTSAATAAVSAAPNNPATGAPTISGTAQVGEMLTADTTGIADADGLDNADFSYQWLADDTDISGETGSAYTLADADEGNTVKVRVSFTDDGGNDETLTSAATATVEAAPNSPATGAPTISGTAQVGETLTADTTGIADADGLDAAAFSYQWLADDTEVAGATGSTYTLVEADEGKTVKVRVSFTDDGGNDETLTSAATEAVAGNEEPVASEDVAVWSATMTVEWVYQGYGYYSTDTKKAGSLSPASFEVDGTTYTVKMVETQGWWTYIGVDREIPFDFVLELDGVRFASGDASFASYSYGNIYRWEGTGLSLRDGDTVEVRLHRAFEDETAVNSPATGQPTISGTVQVGETLTADTSGIKDADGLDNAAFTYRWLADNAAIARATGSTYTLADADEGKAIKVQVSFTDDGGNDETLTSAATDAVAATPTPNSPATGAPTISGTAQVGETLTADTSGIVDENGLENVTFSYQWLADDDAIAGATGSTYTLADADEGKTVKVQVSFTDDAGNDETLTSAATDAVAAATQPNSPSTGAPTTSGTAQVGETLTVDTTGIADEDGLDNATFTFQWLADHADISGATGSTYTLADADEGKAIRVQISFTDDGGNDETLTSAATEAVAGNEEPLTSEDAAAWSATMTVEWVYQGYGYYSTDTKKAGSLSPASFEVDGTTYTVKMVETQGWWMYIGLDREIPFDFVLELNGTRFASNDASFRSYSYGNIYRWEGTGLSLRDGDTVEVRLLRAFEDETAVNSAATGAPTISGTVQVGETLTADTSGIEDADGLDNAAFTYRWLADNAAIAGATGSTYTLADADEGKAITVQVSFTDDGGNDETLTSAATDAVSAAPQPNNPATGAPTVSGTAQVGETLTAGTSGIVDADGLTNATFNYQWLADDADIAGATGSTYTLVEADEGKAIKVRVFFTDDAGNEEELTSGATDAVAAPEPPAKPTGLSATPSHDRVVLTWDDPNDDTITGYVILRRNRETDAQGQFTELAPDTGTAATTYTDDTVAAETPYTYRIKAINEHGTSERSRWFHIDTLAGPEPTQEPTPEPESVSEGDADLPNDNSTPGRVAVGGSATGAIGTDGDQDRFAVELVAGRTYQFDLTGSPGGGGTLPDTFFRAIYNSAGQYQADSYNDDFDGGRDSRVTFTPTESGTYYARVSGDRDEVGSYTLSVTDVTQ